MGSKVLIASLLLVLLGNTNLWAQGRTVARVFWQDDAEGALLYGDLRKSSQGWALEPATLSEFPQLDAEQQSLVQMAEDGGLIVVGIRDHENGSIGSGWVAIDSGVIEQPHGDHSHWHFGSQPQIAKRLIDSNQGNPAHVYRYGNAFVLANDGSNGFSVSTEKQIRTADTAHDAFRFHAGGNRHITLAVVEDQVAYATWIAPAGDDMGRVDVVGLGNNLGRSYSFRCPSGLLHGATVNSGKAFFAPSDGICWVEADLELDDDPTTLALHHLSLGESSDGTPWRTGSFVNLDSFVIFKTGDFENAELCWIQADATEPTLGRLPLKPNQGESFSEPTVFRSRIGRRLCVLFGESRDSPAEDRMLVIDLDPNRDDDFADATLTCEIAVGPNRIEGHSGHHHARFVKDRNILLVSNPGDGTIWLINARDWEVDGQFVVGGTPSRLLVVGGHR